MNTKIIGIQVPEDLLTNLACELRVRLREGEAAKKLHEVTGLRSFNIRRRAYVGDYLLEGCESGAYWPIGTFAIMPMPGCRGIAIFHHVCLEPQFRHKGLGPVLLKAREDAVRAAGFSLAMATVVETNADELSVLRKAGWTTADAFENRRTKHRVFVMTKGL